MRRSPVLLAAVTFAVIFGLLFLILPLQNLVGGRGARLIVFGIAVVASIGLSRQRRISMADLGWGKSRVKPLGVGLLVGSVLVASVVLTMMIAGWVDLKWIGTWSPLLGAFSFGLTVGLVEETLFRLLWFGGFEPVLGTWLTLAFSAALFGILHSFNASATLFSSAAIAVTGGLLLGAMFATGRNLWEVVGVHTAWNTALGGFFGLPVSGSDPVPGVFSATVSGPEPWTGGEFGPEASLVSVALVGAVGVWYVLRALEATISVPVWRT